MPIFVRIGAQAVYFRGLLVRMVDFAFGAFWGIFVRIGTRLLDQNLMNFVRIGTRDTLKMSGVLQPPTRV